MICKKGINMINRDFLKEIKEENFIPVTFTIFNFIDEEYFVRDLEILTGEKYSINDFKYYNLELTDKEKFLIRMHNKNFLSTIYKLQKKFLNEPKLRFFIKFDEGSVLIVKLNSVQL